MNHIKILTVNSSFPEVEHLAAGLAEMGWLSWHVRPYIYKGRFIERWLEKAPLLERVYRRTIGRRAPKCGLPTEKIIEAAVIQDIAFAVLTRLGKNARTLAYARSNAIGKAATKALTDEQAVVATWGVAEPVFEKMKSRGGKCILNYSLAHHSFARRYLLEEAEREPEFASTLNSHDFPGWLTARFDREISLADKILVGSSFAKTTFMSEGVSEEKIEVIPYGADLSLFYPREPRSNPSTQFNVLFAGQISQRKGIAYLLRAYEKIHGPDTSLTMIGRIVGDGSPLKPWQDLFHHIDHVPQSELAEAFRKADVFVFPTLVEGMGLVVVEAMASGLPVITTPNGHGDIVRHGVDGFLVPPRNVDAIAECLEQLRANPDMRILMGQAARARASNFSWGCYREKVVNQIGEWIRM